MNISFTDLKGQYVSIKEEIDDAIYKVIETSSFIRGPFVEQFEENFSNLMNSKHCISCEWDRCIVHLHDSFGR